MQKEIGLQVPLAFRWHWEPSKRAVWVPGRPQMHGPLGMGGGSLSHAREELLLGSTYSSYVTTAASLGRAGETVQAQRYRL